MGLSTRLTLLILLPTIPALFLALRTNLEHRRLGAARVQMDALAVVQLAAADQRGLIDATRQHLAGMASFPQARGNDLTAFDFFFAGMAKVYTNYTDFGLLETNGDLVSCSFGHSQRTNFAHFPHFERAVHTHGLSIGVYEPGIFTNRATLPFAYPVLDEKGRMARLVYAALDLGLLNDLLSRARLPHGGVIDLFDSSGVVLARNPEREKWVGTSFAYSPMFSQMVSKGQGTAELIGVDGVRRLYAFTTIGSEQQGKLFVSVGIPASLAYAETRRVLVRDLSILVGVAAVALVAAWAYANRYVLNPIRTLAKTARQVGSGDLSARAHLDHASEELRQLAQTFDEMTAGLERQRIQQQHSEEEVRELNATLESKVTERTAQLEELNRELEAFSYSVSHDLRAPLRHIVGYVRVLAEDHGSSLSSEGHQVLDTISASAKRMRTLIDDLLAFSHASKAEIRRDAVDSNGLVKQVIRELGSESENKEIQWEIGMLPKVFADEAMLKQVWSNLLSNAIKYSRQRHPVVIQVGCSTRQTEFEFYVRDNGVGFDMENISKLFGVFERLHPADQFEGTGIGLAHVRRIVTRHGGRTWAQAKVDEGATFYFTLPQAGPQ